MSASSSSSASSDDTTTRLQSTINGINESTYDEDVKKVLKTNKTWLSLFLTLFTILDKLILKIDKYHQLKINFSKLVEAFDLFLRSEDVVKVAKMHNNASAEDASAEDVSADALAESRVKIGIITIWMRVGTFLENGIETGVDIFPPLFPVIVNILKKIPDKVVSTNTEETEGYKFFIVLCDFMAVIAVKLLNEEDGEEYKSIIIKGWITMSRLVHVYVSKAGLNKDMKEEIISIASAGVIIDPAYIAKYIV